MPEENTQAQAPGAQSPGPDMQAPARETNPGPKEVPGDLRPYRQADLEKNPLDEKQPYMEGERPATGAERQAMQARKMGKQELDEADRERREYDQKMERQAAEKRRKSADDLKKSMVGQLFLGQMAVEFVREAEKGDIDYHEREARSVVRLPDGTERVVRDRDLRDFPGDRTTGPR